MWIFTINGVSVNYDPDYQDEVYLEKDKKSLMTDLKTLKKIVLALEKAKKQQNIPSK